jgi:saccharopine dehydrogenase-like NADP-dependent oxidoreductase
LYAFFIFKSNFEAYQPLGSLKCSTFVQESFLRIYGNLLKSHKGMNNKVLLIGAGRSASALIRFLAEKVRTQHWRVTVSDVSKDILDKQLSPYPELQGEALDWHPHKMPEHFLASFDIIISLLPPHMHFHVAELCVKYRKHLITASYISPEMHTLHPAATQAGVLLLNEMGLDPGIDHMSAMQMIDNIRKQGGKLTAFRSSTGGLIAPASDNNPWHYKFTWNPRNVVLAGQGTPAMYREKGDYKYVPYHRLFQRVYPIHIDGYGEFEAYPNRDSLHYMPLYGLQDVETMLRGTIRRRGFCSAWDCLVQLGLTNDTLLIDTQNLTWRKLINAFLPYDPQKSVEEKVLHYLNLAEESHEMHCLQWLGLFEDSPVYAPSSRMTPAALLQLLLEQKWALAPSDRDMIVMQHEIEFELDGKRHREISELVVEGEANGITAMAKTVGLPLGIAAELLIEGKVSLRGVQAPLHAELYEPALQRLQAYGICFTHKKETTAL